LHPLILTAFFVSGATSLILETVWVRMLTIVFGATTLAVSTVLTCFMAGLAIGAFVVGRLADRLERPVLFYAAAEAFVGLWSLGIPFVIRYVYPAVNAWLWNQFEAGFWTFSIIRFLAVAVVILPPTTLMGATLPLLARHVMQHRGESAFTGRKVGILYTVNTTGAVGGAFFATFVLLPGAGMTLTNVLTCLAAIALATTVFVFRKSLLAQREDPEAVERATLMSEIAAQTARSFNPTRHQKTVVLVSFFLSGFAAMNFQVILNRIMSLVLGSSVYSFGIVLLAFLMGLALGSAAGSAIAPHVKKPLFALALIQLGAVLGLAALFLYVDTLTMFFGSMIIKKVPSYWEHVGIVKFCMFMVSMAAALPVTLFLGASFPMTVRAAAGDISRVGRDVGGIYAVNTAGAIVGSFASAFILVPFLSRIGDGRGVELAFFVSTGCHALAAVMVVLLSGKKPYVRLATAAAACSFLFVFWTQAPLWNQARMTLGVFRLSSARSAIDPEVWGEPDINYYYDGVSTTVSIERWGRHFALKNNGKVEASNGNDMPTQIVVAAYPLLMHERGPEDLKTVMIGFGSGVSVGSALQFPVRSIDVVEYEPAVVRASFVFGRFEGEASDPDTDVNHLVYRPASDPLTLMPDPAFDPSDPDTFIVNDRLRIINNDGRNFLASTPQRYDVIMSEPSNPWISGVSNLFTVEHFQAAKQALNEDGIFCQWVQLYELSPEMVRVIYRTFASAFEHVMVFAAEDLSSDTILLGSRRPIELDYSKLEKLFEDPVISEEMARAYIYGPTDIYGRLLISSKKELLDYAGSVPVNTDDNLLVEFRAPDDMIGAKKFQGYLAEIYNPEWPWGRINAENLKGVDKPGRADVYAMLSLSMLRHGRKAEAEHFAHRASEDNSAISAVLDRVIALYSGEKPDPVPELDDPVAGPGVEPELLSVLDRRYRVALDAFKENRTVDAMVHLGKIPEFLRNMSGPDIRLLWAYGLVRLPEDAGGDCDEAIDVLNELNRNEYNFVRRHPEVYLYLGRCHDRKLNFDKALKNMQAYAEAVLELENEK